VDNPDVDAFSARDVSTFALERCRGVAVQTAKYRLTMLRSFLRFLFLSGMHGSDLRAAAPSVSGSRFNALPKGLVDEDLQVLLNSCDRLTAVGRRDFAVLLLLARLGLRAVEVARIRLEDVDWSSGEVVIHGKQNQDGLLPLPHDVGEALVAYVRDGRPRRNSRMVFIQARAPYRDLTAGAVKQIVRSAGVRSGVGPIGAHRLRHTAATQMLRRGVPLTQIAQVLRHRSVQTTAVYAKVDREGLRPLARVWPGVTS
jgi:site-specific recombinase XerD